MPPRASTSAVDGLPLPIERGSLSDQGYNPKVVPSQPETKVAPAFGLGHIGRVEFVAGTAAPVPSGRKL